MTREEAIKEVKYIRESFAVNEFSDEAMGMAIEALKEQKTGKWIKKHGIINCSNCKQCGWSESFEATVHRFKYCPNCGADMRGEDNV